MFIKCFTFHYQLSWQDWRRQTAGTHFTEYYQAIQGYCGSRMRSRFHQITVDIVYSNGGEKESFGNIWSWMYMANLPIVDAYSSIIVRIYIQTPTYTVQSHCVHVLKLNTPVHWLFVVDVVFNVCGHWSVDTRYPIRPTGLLCRASDVHTDHRPCWNIQLNYNWQWRHSQQTASTEQTKTFNFSELIIWSQ